MKKWLFASTALFSLFITAIVIAANTNQLPSPLDRIYLLPGGDKAGHFILFGILSLLLNKSALVRYPKQNPYASF